MQLLAPGYVVAIHQFRGARVLLVCYKPLLSEMLVRAVRIYCVTARYRAFGVRRLPGMLCVSSPVET